MTFIFMGLRFKEAFVIPLSVLLQIVFTYLC